MANENRGEVELKTPDGRVFTMKLSTNRMIEIEQGLENLGGVKWTRSVLHAALTSVESQKALSVEEAGDLIDDLGLEEVGRLIEQTRWGSMAKRAKDKAEADAKAKANPPVASTGESGQ